MTEIRIQVPVEIAEQLEKEAARRNMSLSDYASELMLRWLHQKFEDRAATDDEFRKAVERNIQEDYELLVRLADK